MNAERDGHDAKRGAPNRGPHADGGPPDSQDGLRNTRDPVLEALMREHCSETPSPGLDAAILAAAEQAVARPNKRKPPAQSWRLWMPLAAAAVVTIVAFGLVPLAPTLRTDTPKLLRDQPSQASSNIARAETGSVARAQS